GIEFGGNGILTQRIQPAVMPEGAGVRGVVAIEAGKLRRIGETGAVLARKSLPRATFGEVTLGLHIATAEVRLAAREMEHRGHAIAVENDVAFQRGVGIVCT